MVQKSQHLAVNLNDYLTPRFFDKHYKNS